MRTSKSTLAVLGLSLCLLAGNPSFAASAPANKAPVKEQPAPEKPATVMDELSSNKETHEFLSLVKDADLADTLRSKTDSYTVFAPSNSAIDKMPGDVRKKIKSDKEALKAFVKYHVISGSLVYSENIRGRRASPSMMSGEMVSFDGVSSSEPKVNDAKFVAKDISTKNGVVHVVDAAFVPPSFHPQAVQQPPRPTMEPPAGRPMPVGANPPAAMPQPAVAPQETQKADDRPWWKRLFSK